MFASAEDAEDDGARRAAPTARSTAAERLELWRYEQFTELGLTSGQALLLLDEENQHFRVRWLNEFPVPDHHFLRRLLAAGCPLETAVAIAL